MIDAKDRSQLLRMAGNIAAGLVQKPADNDRQIGERAVNIALGIMKAVDQLLKQEASHE